MVSVSVSVSVSVPVPVSVGIVGKRVRNPYLKLKSNSKLKNTTASNGNPTPVAVVAIATTAATAATGKQTPPCRPSLVTPAKKKNHNHIVVPSTPSTTPTPTGTSATGTPIAASSNSSSSNSNSNSSSVVTPRAMPAATATAPKPKQPPPPQRHRSLKQKLKHDIATLKKQRQLVKLQREAQGRRHRLATDAAAKEQQRQVLLNQQQQDRLAKAEERRRGDQRRQEERQIKQDERRCKQAAALRKQHERRHERQVKEELRERLVLDQRRHAQVQYDRAVAEYRRDSEGYRQRHATWVHQRHVWARQQQHQLQMAAARQQQQQQQQMQQQQQQQQQHHMGLTWNGIHSMPPSLLPSSHGHSHSHSHGYGLPSVSSWGVPAPAPAPAPALALAPVCAPVPVVSSTTPIAPTSAGGGADAMEPVVVVAPTSVSSTSTSTYTPSVMPPPLAMWNNLNLFPPLVMSHANANANTNAHAFPWMTGGYTAPAPTGASHLPARMPPHLMIPPLPPIFPKKPRCLMPRRVTAVPSTTTPTPTTNATTTTTTRLCHVLTSPSPYASTHTELLTVILIRNRNTLQVSSSSFGVNLKAYATSALVYPTTTAPPTAPPTALPTTLPTTIASHTENLAPRVEGVVQEAAAVVVRTSNDATTRTSVAATAVEEAASVPVPVAVAMKDMDMDNDYHNHNDHPPCALKDAPSAMEVAMEVESARGGNPQDNDDDDDDDDGNTAPSSSLPMTTAAIDASVVAAPPTTTKPVLAAVAAAAAAAAVAVSNASVTCTLSDGVPASAIIDGIASQSTTTITAPFATANDTTTIPSKKKMEKEEKEAASPMQVDSTNDSNLKTGSSSLSSVPSEEAPKTIVVAIKNEQVVTPMHMDNSIGNLPITTTATTTSATPMVVTPSVTAPVASVPVLVPVPAPKKRRRRRVNFTVMMVVDATKQNARWLERTKDGETAAASTPALLQPDDIIVSIGDTKIAGMTFAEACKVFSTKSVLIGGENDGEIRATLVIARKPRQAVVPVSLPKPLPVLSKPPMASAIIKTDHPSLTSSSSSLAIPANQSSTSARPVFYPSLLSLPSNSSMSFAPTEIAVLADCVIQAIHHPSRLLGQTVSSAALQHTTTLFRQVAGLKGGSCVLSHRSVETLQSKWLQLAQSMTSSLTERGRASWADAFQLEEKTQTSEVVFSSDAERTALRQLPRPAKGCRCKSPDHEYLHDIRCTLYRDLCQYLPADERQELQYDPEAAAAAMTKSRKAKGDLKAVEAAFKDRMVKLKTVTESEEGEARFVARMEEIQVRQLRKAVFAPNVTSMVLSTVMELQREFPAATSSASSMEVDLEDDDDTEEGVTLNTLGGKKRKGIQKVIDADSSKKRKSQQVQNLNFKYLMRMAQFLGKTWGHVYQEPSNEDYAWRWELFHGHNSEDAKWESHSTNPRQPNSLPFDKLRYGIGTNLKSASKLSAASSSIGRLEVAIQSALATEAVEATAGAAAKASSIVKTEAVDSNGSNVAAKSDPAVTSTKADDSTITDAAATTALGSIQAKLDLPDETVEQLCLAAHLLSPSSSGLYDELLAFVKMGVLEISETGIPLLASDWASKVDIVILKDIESAWGTDMDPEGRYCISMEMRDALEEEWVKVSNYGWALSDDPDDLVFDLQLLDEWRESFQGQLEEQANRSEGIGRFGL